MRLIELEVKNYCQHADLCVSFDGYMFGIVGANGTGKSNLLGAVYLALTNENPNDGKKQENVRAGIQPHDASYVKLVFEHAGVRGVVTRHLRAGVRGRLQLGDDPQIDGDEAVTNAIMALLDVDPSTLRQLVMGRQDDLYSVLSEAPAKRAKMLQRLFQADRAELIYGELRDATHRLEGQTERVSQELPDLRVLEQQYHAALAAVGSMRTAEALSNDRDSVVASHTAIGTAISAQQQRASLEATLQQHVQRIAVVQSSLPKLREESQRTEALWVDLTAKQQAQVVLASQYQEMRARSTRLNTLRQQVDASTAALAALLPPVLPAGCDGATAVESCAATAAQTVASLTAREAQLRGLASQDPNSGECPLCHTPAVQIAGRIVAARQEHATVVTELATARASHQCYAGWLQALADYTRKRQALENTVQSTQAAIAAIGDMQVVDFDVASYEQLQQDHRMATTTRGLTASALADATTELTKLETSWQGVISQLSQLPPATDVQALQAQRQHLEGARAAIMAEQAALSSAVQAVTVAKHALERGQAVHADAVSARARQAGRERAITRLQQLRDMFHYDAAVKDVTKDSLNLCEYRLNAVLAAFGARFSVQTRDDLSYDCVFPDKVQPAYRLSCGQRVLLALCLRVALVTTLLPNVGLLLLDEPTTFLDADTIKAFNYALDQLRQFAASSNIQVIVVTHCTELIPSFDTVVSL